MAKINLLEKIYEIDSFLEKNLWGWTQLKALKEPILIFLITRLAIFLVTYYGVVLFFPGFLANHIRGFPDNLLLDSWTRWDWGYYASIAGQGYTTENAQFFPFYPFLIFVFNLFTRNSGLSGIIVSNLSFLLAVILLYKLVQDKFNGKIAGRAVFYLCIFPASFFFVSMLSESTFLLVTVAAFYFAEKDKWLWAGVFGALSALTRPIGIVIFLPLVWLYFEKINFDLKRVRWNLSSLALVPLGLAAIPLVIYPSFGISPFFYLTAHGPWRRWLEYPWWDISTTFEVLSSYQFSDILLGKYPVLAMFTFVTVILFIALIPVLFSKLNKTYGLYASLSILFILLFPSHVSHVGGLLQGDLRYILPIFPYFICFALIGENEFWDKFIVVISLLFLSLFSIYNGLGGWLA